MAYQEHFDGFVRTKLADFYNAIAPFYRARNKDGSGDSLTYFHAHWVRFEHMINMIASNGIDPVDMCELGSFYPYTTFCFHRHGETTIDLYDIILRELDATQHTYEVDGVRLIDFNLCTEVLPQKQYDLIVLSEVLEHLPVDLFAFEKEVVRLVKPGGHLLVSYPLGGKNAKNYGSEFPERDFERLQEDHVREFTKGTTGQFFSDMNKVDEFDFTYRAYGPMRLCLYRR